MSDVVTSLQMSLTRRVISARLFSLPSNNTPVEFRAEIMSRRRQLKKSLKKNSTSCYLVIGSLSPVTSDLPSSSCCLLLTSLIAAYRLSLLLCPLFPVPVSCYLHPASLLSCKFPHCGNNKGYSSACLLFPFTAILLPSFLYAYCFLCAVSLLPAPCLLFAAPCPVPSILLHDSFHSKLTDTFPSEKLRGLCTLRFCSTFWQCSLIRGCA